MATPAHTTHSWRFGVYEVDALKEELRRAGIPLKLREQPFRILVFLLEHAGELVTREDLRKVLWPADTYVDFDHSLNTAVMKLREALGDTADKPLYIETVPKKGYRFVAPVVAAEARRGPGDHNGDSVSFPIDGAGQPGVTTVVPAEKLRTSRRFKILFTAVAAALLLFAAVFILRSFRGPNLPHLAVEQRLTANPSDVPVNAAVISPDGKYLAYADSSGLYLRQIPSGETRPVTLSKGFVAWPRSWYPDGTHLLIVSVPGPSSDLKWSLYKLSILGGEPQEIVSDAWDGSVSPDGSRIAYVPVPNTGDLWIMDSDGSNARKVVAGPEPHMGGLFGGGLFGQDLIYRVVWSPTGQHLAYIQAHYRNTPAPVEPINSLRIVDPDGGGAGVVLEDARLGPALWWGPEDRILFSYREDPANAQRNYGVYSIRIDGRTGKAIGPPQPVTRGEGVIGGLTGTADGKRLVLWRFRQTDQTFISDYDAETGQWKEPRRLILDANTNLAWAWTADSKAVFFVSNRNGTWKLFKQAIDETSPEVLVEGRSISLPRLSADGKQVLYLSSSNPDDASFPAEVMSNPIAGGTPRVVLQGIGIGNFQCAMAPSTLCLFSQVDGGDLVFRVLDLEQGAGRELLRLPLQTLSGNGNWSLSSDGSKLAIFLDRHRIRFFSIATGAAHDVTVKGWPLWNGDWGSKGQTIFMPSQSPVGVPVILEVDQTGKAKVVLVGEPSTYFGWMIQSPDSRHAVVGESIPTDNNAWILSDF